MRMKVGILIIVMEMQRTRVLLRNKNHRIRVTCRKSRVKIGKMDLVLSVFTA